VVCAECSGAQDRSPARLRGLKMSRRYDDQLAVSNQEFFTEEFHAKTSVGAVLVLSGVAFAAWMAGAWMSNLHSSVHIIGAWIAIAGAVVTVFGGWLAARAWSVQRQRRCAHVRAMRGRRCRHRPSGVFTALALLPGVAEGRPQRQTGSSTHPA
jgi:hypothetical protein